MCSETLIGGPRWRRVLQDCVDCGFSESDAEHFARRIWRGMPGLAEIDLNSGADLAADCFSGGRPAIPRVVSAGEGLRGAQ
jgi:hypothetical protein